MCNSLTLKISLLPQSWHIHEENWALTSHTKAHFMTEVLTGVIPGVDQRQQRQVLSVSWSDPQRPRASPSSPGMNLKTSCKQEAMQGHIAVMFSFLLYGLLWVCLALSWPLIPGS